LLEKDAIPVVADCARGEEVTRQPLTHLLMAGPKIAGREEAIQETSELIRCERLVSLVAAGGIGTTAVAISVARFLRQEFDDSVYFLNLAAHSSPLAACRELASVLNISVGTHVWLLDLLRVLQDRRALLVLDSCEHAVEAVAALVELLLRAAPQVHLLATSRKPLGAEGERIVALPPLKCSPRRSRLVNAAALSRSNLLLGVLLTVAGASHALADSPFGSPLGSLTAVGQVSAVCGVTAGDQRPRATAPPIEVYNAALNQLNDLTLMPYPAGAAPSAPVFNDAGAELTLAYEWRLPEIHPGDENPRSMDLSLEQLHVGSELLDISDNAFTPGDYQIGAKAGFADAASWDCPEILPRSSPMRIDYSNLLDVQAGSLFKDKSNRFKYGYVSATNIDWTMGVRFSF
jgi:hypothetical protein